MITKSTSAITSPLPAPVPVPGTQRIQAPPVVEYSDIGMERIWLSSGQITLTKWTNGAPGDLPPGSLKVSGAGTFGGLS